MKQSIFYHSWVKTEVLSGCHCHPDDWLSEQRSAHTHLEHGGASLHKPLGIVLRNSVLLPVSRCSFVLKRWNRKFLLRFTVQRLQRIQWDLRGVHATHPTKCQPCSVVFWTYCCSVALSFFKWISSHLYSLLFLSCCQKANESSNIPSCYLFVFIGVECNSVSIKNARNCSVRCVVAWIAAQHVHAQRWSAAQHYQGTTRRKQQQSKCSRTWRLFACFASSCAEEPEVCSFGNDPRTESFKPWGGEVRRPKSFVRVGVMAGITNIVKAALILTVCVHLAVIAKCGRSDNRRPNRRVIREESRSGVVYRRGDVSFRMLLACLLQLICIEVRKCRLKQVVLLTHIFSFIANPVRPSTWCAAYPLQPKAWQKFVQITCVLSLEYWKSKEKYLRFWFNVCACVRFSSGATRSTWTRRSSRKSRYAWHAWASRIQRR